MLVDPKDIQLGGAAFPELTQDAWKKNKGLVAKMKGETGLTNALNALETKVTALKTLLASKPSFPAENFVPGTSLKGWRSSSDAYASQTIAAAHEVIDAVSAVETAASATAREYRTSSTIPKKSREFVERMEKSAAAYAKQVAGMLSKRNIDAYLDQKQAIVQQQIADFLRQAQAASWEIMVQAAHKVDKLAAVNWAQVSKAKPAEALKLWDTGMHQPLRAIFAGLLKMPNEADAVELLKTYKSLNRGDHMGYSNMAVDELQDVYDEAHVFSAALQKVAAHHT